MQGSEQPWEDGTGSLAMSTRTAWCVLLCRRPAWCPVGAGTVGSVLLTYAALLNMENAGAQSPRDPSEATVAGSPLPSRRVIDPGQQMLLPPHPEVPVPVCGDSRNAQVPCVRVLESAGVITSRPSTYWPATPCPVPLVDEGTGTGRVGSPSQAGRSGRVVPPAFRLECMLSITGGAHVPRFAKAIGKPEGVRRWRGHA